MMRIGVSLSCMVRICTGEVCVRSTMRDPSCFGIEVEGVVLLAGRMVIGNVQGTELYQSVSI